MLHRRMFVVLFSVLMVLVGYSAVQAVNDAHSLAGKVAPEVRLKTLEGKDFSLKDWKGEVVILEFFATWCPPCLESMGNLHTYDQNAELKAKGLRCLAINFHEKPEIVRKFIEDKGYRMTVLLDPEMKARDAFNAVEGYSTTFVIARDGSVRNVFVGSDQAAIAKAVEEALAEVAPTTQESPKP